MGRWRWFCDAYEPDDDGIGPATQYPERAGYKHREHEPVTGMGSSPDGQPESPVDPEDMRLARLRGNRGCRFRYGYRQRP